MGARQSGVGVPPAPAGRQKFTYNSGYVITSDPVSGGRGLSSGEATTWSTVPGPSSPSTAFVVGYPGPVARAAAPTSWSSSPSTAVGTVPVVPRRRPAPPPPTATAASPGVTPTSTNPSTPSLHPLSTTTGAPVDQSLPTTTQPRRATVAGIFPVESGEGTVTVGGAEGATTTPGSDGDAVALNSIPRDGSSGMMEVIQSFLMSPPRFMIFSDLKCSVCHKTIPSDGIELHLSTCLTKPQLIYNEDVLLTDKGECSICFDDLQKGNTIARLPCLCVYHKSCIDDWFTVSRCCPEHPES